MDDQTQGPFDPDVTQVPARSKREVSLPTRPNQPMQISEEWSQAIPFPEVDVEIFEEVELAPRPRRQRLVRTRRWLRSRSGRVVVPLVALLVGLAVGLASILWYGWSGEGSIVIIPSTVRGNLSIEANKDLVTELVLKNITNAGLPGQVKNVNVALMHGQALTIQGDDVYSLLGLNLSRHFTIKVQPYVQSCVLQVRMVHADLGGLPVTAFVQTFEDNVNRQLGQKPTGLPGDFIYCAVGVRTEPGGMFITYEAVASGK